MKNMKANYLFIIVAISLLSGCKSLPPSVNSFKSNSTSIEVGETAQLQWDIKDAKKCNISISSVGSDLENQGNKNISPEKTTEYILKINKKGKTLAEKKVTVEVLTPEIIKFNASPSSVNKGEKTTLTWDVINVKNCIVSLAERDMNFPPNDSDRPQLDIEEVETNLLSSGNKDIKVDYLPKEYVLTVSRNNKEIISQSITINTKKEHLSNSKINTTTKNNIKVSEGPDDGRFSIGGNGKRLMYGYPISKSTSHFVINVDGVEASNTPSLKSKAIYLTGNQTIRGEKGSIHTEISFMFNGVEITQKLTPVNKDLEEADLNEFGQFYKISYEIKNTSTKTKNVSLFLLFDTMIDDNDATQMNSENKKTKYEKVFKGNNIPENITFYSSDKSLSSECIIKTENSINPDEFYIGRWSYLHSVVSAIKPNNSKYGDSGFIIRWSDKNINANDSIVLFTVYGIHGKGTVEVVSSKKLIEFKETVYFDYDENNLCNSEKEKINKLFFKIKSKNTSIEGAMISGYTDAKGTDEFNMQLSKKRINVVSDYLHTKGIKKAHIIPKAYGENNAIQNNEYIENGNKKDRKCEILIYGENKN